MIFKVGCVFLYFYTVVYMEKGSRSYQLGLCMEQDIAIALHGQFPLCTEVLVVLSLGFLASL